MSHHTGSRLNMFVDLTVQPASTPPLDMFKRFQDLTVPPSTDTFKLVHNEARTVGKHPIGMLSFFILILASFKQMPKKF